jgi:hypothetical protein
MPMMLGADERRMPGADDAERQQVERQADQEQNPETDRCDLTAEAAGAGRSHPARLGRRSLPTVIRVHRSVDHTTGDVAAARNALPFGTPETEAFG